MKSYKVHSAYHASSNSILEVFRLSQFVDIYKYSMDKAWINPGGWQSWNPAYEIAPGKKQASLTCHLIKDWNQYLVFPESNFSPSKNLVLTQFITYLRWDDFYLVFASVGNVNKTLPPVQFIFNRKTGTITLEICDKGNDWKENDIMAEIEIFTASSYFECREKLSEIYGNNHFEKIKALGKNPAGWESWYNHYADINEKLILDDLASLNKTENVITLGNYSSKIFQIDDGWENALGQWTVRKDRFPQGLSPLASKIESQGYIPGLWIAPFIIDSRCKTASEHPDWLLRDEEGNLVGAGYNPLWGQKGTFYCLDLSIDEVISYLDNLMNTIINDWGFRYIKLDFLYAGMLYGNHKNQTASYKMYCRALNTLTSRQKTNDGKDVFYLGCGVPFELSFKYLPLSRIGCDTQEHWKNKMLRLINWNGRNEAYLNVKDTLGHAMWNNIIFANDPDVIFVRNENCTLTKKQKILIAFIDQLFGSQLMYSDDPEKSSSEEEVKLAKEIVEFQKKYCDEEFGLKNISEDKYKIFSKSGKYTGEIDLANMGNKDHTHIINGE